MQLAFKVLARVRPVTGEIVLNPMRADGVQDAAKAARLVSGLPGLDERVEGILLAEPHGSAIQGSSRIRGHDLTGLGEAMPY